MAYANTNEKLYDDIALWEKTDGRDLFLEMPLKEKDSPQILDFGYGFGEQLFALTNAYPNAKIFGIDGNPACQKEVAEKISQRKINNITLINKMVNDLSDFTDNSMDLVLLTMRSMQPATNICFTKNQTVSLKQVVSFQSFPFT